MWKLPRYRIVVRSSGLPGFLAALVFGMAWAFFVTPDGFIAGTSSYWQTQVEDIAQYHSGYLAYVNAPWSFPLLKIPSLNWPLGTTVTFVDAIPVFSIVMKVLSQVIALPDNPFGMWVLACFGIQGVAAWYAASQLDGDNWTLLGLIVALCVLMPSLTARMGHLSLQAHFILLFALGLYIRTQRQQRSQIANWTIVLIVSFYINFYITLMALSILFACQVDLYRDVRNKRVFIDGFIPILTIAVTVPIMLGTAFGNAVPDTGFGYYSMNLLSPIAQGSLISLPFFVDATGGQYEGFNYLGLGLILLVLLSLTRWARTPARWCGPGICLVLVLIALTIYALSNEVYVGPLHLLHWRVPGDLRPLFEAFRSSGRFFWPVSYAAVLFAAARFNGLRPPYLHAALALFVLSIQIVDLKPFFESTRMVLNREPNEPADIARWNEALAGVSTIHAFPKFKCEGALIREILPLQTVAARGGYNLTTGFISRYGADCDAIAAEIKASDPSNSAYVFANAQFDDSRIVSYLGAGFRCQKLDIWSLCRREKP